MQIRIAQVLFGALQVTHKEDHSLNGTETASDHAQVNLSPYTLPVTLVSDRFYRNQ